MTEAPRSRRRYRRRKKRSRAAGLLSVVVLLILLIAGAGAYRTFGPETETIPLEELFGVSGEDAAVLYQYQLQSAEGRVRDGEYYLPADWVQAILNQRFFWDEEENILVYALPEEVLTFDGSSAGTKGQKLLFTEGERAFLSSELILRYTDVRIEGFTGDGISRIFVEETPESDQVALSKNKGALRASPGLRGRVVRKLEKGETLRLIPNRWNLDPGENWTRVMTEDGLTAYVHNWHLKDGEERPVENRFSPVVYSHLRQEEPVVLGWHQVTVRAANGNLDGLIAEAEGLNVISPTWFSLRGNEGEFEDFSSADYVSKAHGKGLQVWALLDNLDESVTLGEVLKRTSVRRALAENLVGAVKACGADGINVDFELLRKDAARQYLQFIRELSVFCRNSGLVLSVDVPNPAAYNLHYDRRELGEVCDYVVNMGYDEHTSGDDPGSTASIGFFRRGLTETLEEIPPEALIGGVPFYTRAWTVSGGEVQSRALTMEGAQNWVEEHDAGLNWDEECGQYYAEKESSGGTVSMLWMEDARSLELKFAALKTSRAAGVACWRLGTETADVWKVLFSSFLK